MTTPSETRPRLSDPDPDATGPPAHTPPRPEVRFAAGSAPSDAQGEEFRSFLRRRLAVLATVCFFAVLLLEGGVTPFQLADGSWRHFIGGWALVALCGGMSAVLWCVPRMSVRALRCVETVWLLALVAFLTQDLIHRLFDQRDIACFYQAGHEAVVWLGPMPYQPAGPDRLRIYDLSDWLMWAMTALHTLGWVFLVVAYGLLIPNPWRRAAVTVVWVAAIPVVLEVTAAVIEPDVSWKHAGIVILGTVVFMGFAAAIGVAGSYRVDRLRKQLATARQLGQYRLTEKLGTGGMGEVFRAEHVLLRRPCAVKLIRPDRTADPTALQRFEREVQATATLTNWHTVEIYDFGHTADGTFYYVMEYLPGLTLDDLVKAAGPLPPGRAVRLLRQLCVALREAHGIGLIHRDVKPGNVIVGERGGLADVAKLLDFGLVRTPDLSDDAEKLTATGAVLGTPAYMAPEQAGEEADVTAAADIYSLGAVGYFLLSGRPPFAGRSPLKTIAAHLHEPPPPLRAVCPGVPADLEAVVLRCLAKRPDERFGTIDVLDRALAECRCAGEWSEADAVGWWHAHRPTTTLTA